MDDHHSAVGALIDNGRTCDSYLIGAGGEQGNKQVVQAILWAFGQPEGAYMHVTDRPGHDLRYAIEGGKMRAELGWVPQYRDFEAGLRATVARFRDNEQWGWRVKDHAEAADTAAGEVVTP